MNLETFLCPLSLEMWVLGRLRPDYAVVGIKRAVNVDPWDLLAPMTAYPEDRPAVFQCTRKPPVADGWQEIVLKVEAVDAEPEEPPVIGSTQTWRRRAVEPLFVCRPRNEAPVPIGLQEAPMRLDVHGRHSRPYPGELRPGDVFTYPGGAQYIFLSVLLVTYDFVTIWALPVRDRPRTINIRLRTGDRVHLLGRKEVYR